MALSTSLLSDDISLFVYTCFAHSCNARRLEEEYIKWFSKVMPFATSETANGQPSRIVLNVYGYYDKVLIVIEKYVDL